jgi:hypothetical protein
MPVLTCPTMPTSSATGQGAKEPLVKDLIRQEHCDLFVPVGQRCPPIKSLIRRCGEHQRAIQHPTQLSGNFFFAERCSGRVTFNAARSQRRQFSWVGKRALQGFAHLRLLAVLSPGVCQVRQQITQFISNTSHEEKLEYPGLNQLNEPIPDQFEPLLPTDQLALLPHRLPDGSRFRLFSGVGNNAAERRAADQNLGVRAHFVPHALAESVIVEQFDQSIDQLAPISIYIAHSFYTNPRYRTELLYTIRQAFERIGGAKGTRTPGLLDANQTLFQLSYSPASLRVLQTAARTGICQSRTCTTVRAALYTSRSPLSARVMTRTGMPGLS